MYKKIVIITLLFFGFFTNLFAGVNADTLKEKYIPKVIIHAKWGKGPGEFGLIPDPDEISGGPCALAIKNKKIYIFDGVNRRINVYSIDGTFLNSIDLKNYRIEEAFIGSGINALAIDDEGNFYLLGYDGPSGGSKILEFDPKGNFVKEVWKSPIDEKANQASIYLPPPLSRAKEKHDSLGILLKNYESTGKRAPSILKSEYDSLGSLIEDFISRMKRKEPRRLHCEPVLKIKGDTLITVVYSKGIVYIDKNSGKILKGNNKVSIKKLERCFHYPEDCPDIIKNGIGLSKELKKFVLSARYNPAISSAHGFDNEGNFYELIWDVIRDDSKYKDMGVIVIKWEKVQ